MLCTFEYLIHPKTLPVPEGGYMVAVFKPEKEVPDQDGKYHKRVTIVGTAIPTTKNIKFEMKGRWERNKYGLQYKMDSYREVVESTKDGIIGYLSSGIIKGIGLGMAKKIYTAFGDDTMKVLENDPNRLLQVSGISQGKLRQIKDSVIRSHGLRDLLELGKPELTIQLAGKILANYKSESIGLIKEDPYRFFLDGFLSFTTADSIAMRNGLSILNPLRLAAGLLYCLKRQELQGHLAMTRSQFISDSMDTLGLNRSQKKNLCTVANTMFQDGRIHIYGDMVFSDAADEAERVVASRIKNLLAFGCTSYSMDLDTLIFQQEELLNIKLSPMQVQAVKMGLSHNLSIITGGPGTGKTQVLQFILGIYQSEYPEQDTLCCAPTGRAARRMEEASGLPASTIHSALSVTTQDSGVLTESQPIDAGLVIVDEISMLDIYLAQRLFEAVSYDTKVILVGDADQLPSVGPGAVLSELIVSGQIPMTKLDKVFRQHAGSRIAVNAALIRNNNYSLEYGDDFVLEESPELNHSAELLRDIYLEEVRKYGQDNVTLLSPMRQKYETSVQPMNELLRAALNPPAAEKSEVKIRDRVFRVGDKVMQTKNAGDVNNGDIGYMRKIFFEGKSQKVLIEFDGSHLKQYGIEELATLELGYATTIHKAQGSEYQSVILNVQLAHSVMLRRPLLYTAITRAKHRLIIVGERGALIQAIQRTDAEKRLTLLSNRIQGSV